MPVVEVAPDNPEIFGERKRQREAKKKYLEDTKRLLEEKRRREEQEKLEQENNPKSGDDEANEKNEIELNDGNENLTVSNSPESPPPDQVNCPPNIIIK